jgi:hypothetical protein
MKLLKKDTILVGHNATVTLDRPEEKKCALKIIYHGHNIKKFLTPLPSPVWTCANGVCLSLLHRWEISADPKIVIYEKMLCHFLIV